jgi:serine/threonine-protein kinase
MLLIASAVFFARQNLRMGRGDRRGATRLMMTTLAIWLTGWALIEHHVGTAGEWLLYFVAAGALGSAGAALWVLYVAVEPFVRRRWPHMLISWSRLLAGAWRDPLVGRDVLLGSAAGVAIAGIQAASLAAARWAGARSLTLSSTDWNMLNRTASFVGAVLGQFASAILEGLFSLMLLFLLRLILRRDWVAACALIFFGAAIFSGTTFGSSSIVVPFMLAAGCVFVLILTRAGLVSAVVAIYVGATFSLAPITLRPSAWYGPAGFVALGLVFAIGLFGCATSLGGRRLLDLVES